jgi:tRNA-Thr(GGU) m(6)t(6)A37 methyltransferase TsaA
MKPIGVVRSPYDEKFGVPRQAGLAPEVEAWIELDPAVVEPESLRGLDGCSHLWVLFELHLAGASPGATVRPPRLGGNARLGVFATRSPFRPNPIGLSAVALQRVEGMTLCIRGGDFVNGTPVLDLKPYLPYADAIVEARCAWAMSPPVSLALEFSAEANAALESHPQGEALRSIIEQSLRWDPRPAYRRDHDGDRVHGVSFLGVNVRFRAADGVVRVESVG